MEVPTIIPVRARKIRLENLADFGWVFKGALLVSAFVGSLEEGTNLLETQCVGDVFFGLHFNYDKKTWVGGLFMLF